MQKTTLRYRIRKAKIGDAQQQDQAPTRSSNTVLHPPPIASSACDDDGSSQPLMVTSRVQNFFLQKTLLDGGLVELINRKLVDRMRPRLKSFQTAESKSV